MNKDTKWRIGLNLVSFVVLGVTAYIMDRNIKREEQNRLDREFEEVLAIINS